VNGRAWWFLTELSHDPDRRGVAAAPPALGEPSVARSCMGVFRPVSRGRGRRCGAVSSRAISWWTISQTTFSEYHNFYIFTHLYKQFTQTNTDM